MFGGFSASKLKPQLRMAASRMEIASQKKSALLQYSMREVALLLSEDPPKEEKAKIRAEALIRDDNLIEAYQILQLHCEVLHERVKLLEFSKTCPPDLVSVVATLMWASQWVDSVPELSLIRKQFRAKYGKKFEEDALDNKDGLFLNARVVSKLTVQPPAAYLVQTYLEKVCAQHQVHWTPKMKILPIGDSGMMIQPMAAPTGYSVQVAQGTGLGNSIDYSISASPTSTIVAITGQESSNKRYDDDNNNDDDDDIAGGGNGEGAPDLGGSMTVVVPKLPLYPSAPSIVNDSMSEDESFKENEKADNNCLATGAPLVPAPYLASDDVGVGKKLLPHYGLQYFKEWEAQLREKLLRTLPALSNLIDAPSISRFEQSLQIVDDAFAARENATKRHQEIQSKDPGNRDELKQAKASVEASQKCLHQVVSKCEEIAWAMLDKLESFCAPETFDDGDLITYVALTKATAEKLSQWCAMGEEITTLILKSLRNTELLRQFLRSGGPSDNDYLKAFEIYAQLNPPDDDPVLQRLALAVALEFAGEIFRPVSSAPIDPVERYLHYERAYLDGELDPAFSQLSTWEMRLVVDSDASNEELAWGRESLRNYRPDYVLLNDHDPTARYLQIVHSDIDYKEAVFYKPERSYDQILSGGGMCGPRAWYGRFICKAFGIPTWGCRQEGHAALSRWTPQGWQTCLGAGFDKSWWNDTCGAFFLLQTKALYALRSEDAYLRHVQRLWWIGHLHNEPSHRLQGEAVPESKCIWKSLAFFQMTRYALQCTNEPLHSKSKIETILEKLEKQNDDIEQIERSGSTIRIPGTLTSRCSRILPLKGFAGGRQIVFIENNAEAEYTLPADVLSSQSDPTARTAAGRSSGWKRYKLMCQVCTVHRNNVDPFLLTVTTNGMTTTSPLVIPIPYTAGMWQDTEAISLELHDTGATLTLVRPTTRHSVSMKCVKIILAP